MPASDEAAQKRSRAENGFAEGYIRVNEKGVIRMNNAVLKTWRY
jgi:hypothetical protein